MPRSATLRSILADPLPEPGKTEFRLMLQPNAVGFSRLNSQSVHGVSRHKTRLHLRTEQLFTCPPLISSLWPQL